MADAELKEAVRRIRAGDRAGGRQLLVEILKEEPDNDDAWVWMSTVVEGEELQRECLEEALAHNPYNELARRALQELGGETWPEDAAPEAKGGGLSRRRRYKRPSAGVLALLLIVAVVAAAVAAFDRRNVVRLRDEWVVVEARLTNARAREEDGETVHEVKYAFTAGDGETYTAAQMLTGSEIWVRVEAPVWNEAMDQAALPVRYVPADPALNRPEAEGVELGTPFFAGSVTAVLAVVVGILLYVFGVPSLREVVGRK